MTICQPHPANSNTLPLSINPANHLRTATGFRKIHLLLQNPISREDPTSQTRTTTSMLLFMKNTLLSTDAHIIPQKQGKVKPKHDEHCTHHWSVGQAARPPPTKLWITVDTVDKARGSKERAAALPLCGRVKGGREGGCSDTVELGILWNYPLLPVPFM